ncbi:MAG: hypothetical protein U0Z53_12515 [Blastocatellia bacterium]
MMKSVIATVCALFLLVPSVRFAQTATRARKPAGAADRIEFQMTAIRDTGIKFPRLTFYADAKVMKEVNRQIDEVTGEFGCEPDENGKKGSFEVRAKVEYAARQIFSIYVSESFFCGGAYPTNDYNNSLTFDLKTGKLSEFEDLFQDYEKNKTEILKVIFAKQIEQSEKLAAAGQQKTESCEGDPDLYSLEHLESDTFAFNFSAEGLRVQPAWPHVIEACAERVTVPYEKLRKFAAPGGLLARVLR